MATGKYQFYRPLTGDEYARLKEDIRENGFNRPVVIDDESGEVLDGHHRLQIAAELGVEAPVERRRFETEAARIKFVYGENIMGRQLAANDVRAAYAKQEELLAGLSTRAAAEALGVSKDTVQRGRVLLSHDETVESPTHRRGADGKLHPAKKPTADESAELDSQIQMLHEQGMTGAAIARQLGVWPSRVSRALSKDRILPAAPEPRDEVIRRMANEGALAADISAAIGIGMEYTKRRAKLLGVQIVDAEGGVLARRRVNIDAHDVLVNLIISIVIPDVVMEAVEGKSMAIESDEATELVEQLDDAISKLNRIRRVVRTYRNGSGGSIVVE